MAAEVEVQSGEMGRSVAAGRLHLSPLTDSNNKNLMEISTLNQSHIISPEPSKPAPGPKPRLTPKPFTVERNATIKPILAPKPQPKPRPESTRLSGYKPDPPTTRKPQQPPAIRPTTTNPSRPSPTSFKSPKLNGGQTTKPVAQPFKPAPPLVGDPSKPISPVPAERQKPSNLTHSRSLKRPPSAEWSGSTKREETDSGSPSKVGTSITRAKSMGYLLQIGQEEEEKTKSEAAVPLRPHPRGVRPRPVSAIFPTTPINTESPNSTAFSRPDIRPLSADLTSKFGSIGLHLHRKTQNVKENTPEDKVLLQKKEQEKSPTTKSPESNGGATKPAASDQSNQTKDNVSAKDTEDMRGVSIKSRISLLLDSSSSVVTPAPGQAPDVHSPMQTGPEAEPAVGVKQLIKQLTVDTTPNQSPVLKPALKPRPLPLDLTKRFSPDPGVSLNETTDRHDTSKSPQKRNEDLANTPSDLKSFVDFQDQLKTPVSVGSDLLFCPKETEVQTVRASLFENVVEKHSVLMVDENKSEIKAPSSPLLLDKPHEEGKVVTATYKEPVSPSGPVCVVHSFDTVPAAEESTAISESVLSAQREDKAMTLRLRRSEVTKTATEKTGPESAPTAPRYLRVGALPKWTLDLNQETDLETGMPKDVQREDKPVEFELLEDISATARTEEQAKPRVTYFALTGQMQETATATSDTGDMPFSDQKISPFRMNPSLDEAFGKTSEDNAVNEREKQKQLESERQAQLEFARMKEREMQREFERERQKAFEKEKREFEEKQRALEIKEQIELERQKHLEFEKQRQLKLKRQRQQELERQRQMEIEKQTDRQQQIELENQVQVELKKQRQELERQKQVEMERQKQLELEKQHQIELERQRQIEIQKQNQLDAEKQRLERQKQIEMERQKQIELEQLKQIELEKQRQKQAEIEKHRQIEMEKQRQIEAERQYQKELERMKQIELEKQRQFELERQRQLEIERERKAEIEKQRQIELEKQRQIEAERQKQKEHERQKQIELEKQRQRELERQKLEEIERAKQMELEKERQRQLDKERHELEKQRQKEEERRQKELDKERRLLEKQKERQRLQAEEQERRQRQQVLELEKQRLREKMEREQAEKLRQMALEQETLRLRELDKERERQKEMEREKQREQELQRQRELERERQKQLDLEAQELQKQSLRQQEQEKERLKKEELERFQEMERRQLLEFEKQKQAGRQQVLELEKRRLREKMEREEADKMRQIAKQQEGERQRLKEKQKKEEQERIRLESESLRPKVVDIDAVLRNVQAKTSSRSDVSTRWKEPSPKAEQTFRPGTLDNLILQSQSYPSRDLFPVSGIVESGTRTPMLPHNSGGLQSPVWTMSLQDPWEMRSVEMSVDKPEQTRKQQSKTSPEQLLLKQEEHNQAPQRCWSALVDDPFQMAPFSETKAAGSATGVSSSFPVDQGWLSRDPPAQPRSEGPSQRRSQGSQELTRLRSRSMSRRSAPANSAVEGSLYRMRSRSAHRDQVQDGWQKQSASTEDELKDSETPVHDTDSQYGTWETGLRSEDSLTPATPSSESNLSPSPRKPTSPKTPVDDTPRLDTADGVLLSSSESQPLSFPDASVTLLDNSAQRSRAQLGKKRAPRTRPSRAARQAAAQDETATEDHLYKDSTEEKKVESKNEDSDSEEKVIGVDAGHAATPQPQRVALFPGMDPSALMAQLKKRGESDNQTDGPTPAPSQLSRSPKSPFLPRAARVLPPSGGKENGEEDSPQWLKELKSKKRLSQYETES